VFTADEASEFLERGWPADDGWTTAVAADLVALPLPLAWHASVIAGQQRSDSAWF